MDMWLVLLLVGFSSPLASSAENVTNEGEGRFHVVTVDWEKIQLPFGIALWLLLATVVKIGPFLQAICVASFDTYRNRLTICRLPQLGRFHTAHPIQRDGNPTRPRHWWNNRSLESLWR